MHTGTPSTIPVSGSKEDRIPPVIACIGVLPTAASSSASASRGWPAMNSACQSSAGTSATSVTRSRLDDDPKQLHRQRVVAHDMDAAVFLAPAGRHVQLQRAAVAADRLVLVLELTLTVLVQLVQPAAGLAATAIENLDRKRVGQPV